MADKKYITVIGAGLASAIVITTLAIVGFKSKINKKVPDENRVTSINQKVEIQTLIKNIDTNLNIQKEIKDKIISLPDKLSKTSQKSIDEANNELLSLYHLLLEYGTYDNENLEELEKKLENFFDFDPFNINIIDFLNPEAKTSNCYKFYKSIKNNEKIPKETIQNLIEKANEIVLTESPYLKLETSTPVNYCSDFHGQLNSGTKGIIDMLHRGEIVIVGGDLGDRFPNSLELIAFFAYLKIVFKDRFYILRGNHDSIKFGKKINCNYSYSLRSEAKEKYDEDDEKSGLLNTIFTFFSNLSVMQETKFPNGKVILFSHAAPFEYFKRCENRTDLETLINETFKKPNPSDDESYKFFWSDICFKNHEDFSTTSFIDGTADNEGRGTGYYHTVDLVEQLLNKLGITTYIHGHSHENPVSLLDGRILKCLNCILKGEPAIWHVTPDKNEHIRVFKE